MANFESKALITDIDEFLTDLTAFAVANAGFTSNGKDISGTEDLYRISRTTSTVTTYWGFRKNTISHSSYSNIRVQSRMMLSLPTDTNFETVADGQRLPTNMGLFDVAPVFTAYYFFTDGVSVFAVLEVTSGVFAHMAFGDITKIGTWTGGAYLTANNYQYNSSLNLWRDVYNDSSHNSSPQILGSRVNLTSSTTVGAGYVRYNTGAGDNKDFTKLGGRDHTSDGALVGASGGIPPNYNSTRVTLSSSDCHLDIQRRLQQAAPSEATFRAPLMPPYISRQTASLTKAQPIGYVPNVASVNMYVLNNKEIVNTDWKVFALSYKGSDASVASRSDIWGIAYRQVP